MLKCRKSLVSKYAEKLFIFSLAIVLVVSCQTRAVESSLDYSDKANWAYYDEGNGDSVDLFIICPTVDMGRNGNLNMALDDEQTKSNFVGALNMERGIYDEYTSMYAPFYRQMTFPLYENREAESGLPLEIAYSDIKEAFLYYIENINEGRPFILAGFSQGAQLTIMLLKEFFDDPSLANKLVAAYCIGWHITEEETNEYPHLKMAEGENDTGVIITFSTEAESIDDTIIVPKGIKTFSINPLNWKTDSTPATKEENIGACFTNYSGEIEKEIPHLTGAYIDPERGTLKAVDIKPEDYSNSLFPDGVYHLYDYQFFFLDLKENVDARINSYLSK